MYQADDEREDGDHLCTDSTLTAKGIQCDKIRCIVRRKMLTEDPDDMNFVPGSAGVAMNMPSGYSYIMMN